MRSGQKRVLVVGAGMSGLTAAAYLLRTGCQVTVLEKSSAPGGLLATFDHEGFLFDAGPRAVGNAGILKPMLEDLGISLPMVRGQVSIGIGQGIIHVDSREGLNGYLDLLVRLFPAAGAEIARIGSRMRTEGKIVETLNRVANPFFKDIPGDRAYLLREFLPWLPAFLGATLRSSIPDQGVEAALAALSSDGHLRDIVSQHFFRGTPARFALGYFENFLDYWYPLGGTGRIPAALAAKVEAEGGAILYSTEVAWVDADGKRAYDHAGRVYEYNALLWAADLKSLYQRILPSGHGGGRARECEAEHILSARPGESVFTLFLGLDEDPERFRSVSRGHLIYTPSPEGLGGLRGEAMGLSGLEGDGLRRAVLAELGEFCARNSYEISIPVLKDPAAAPPGRTGLIVSILADGGLFSQARVGGWQDELKEGLAASMLDPLEGSLYPGLRKKIIFMKTASPLSIMDRFGSSEGAVTGWSMEDRPPVPRSLAGIMAAPRTALPSVYKAGQWSYSPSGVPIAVFTGRLAARAICAELGCRRNGRG